MYSFPCKFLRGTTMIMRKLQRREIEKKKNNRNKFTVKNDIFVLKCCVHELPFRCSRTQAGTWRKLHVWRDRPRERHNTCIYVSFAIVNRWFSGVRWGGIGAKVCVECIDQRFNEKFATHCQWQWGMVEWAMTRQRTSKPNTPNRFILEQNMSAFIVVSRHFLCRTKTTNALSRYQ